MEASEPQILGASSVACVYNLLDGKIEDEGDSFHVLGGFGVTARGSDALERVDA
jgi:hypothetical protein